MVPAPRFGHGAIYDQIRNRMIVFGGFDSTTYFSDVWQLSFATTPGDGTWSQLTPQADPTHGSPIGRYGHAMSYDPGTESTLESHASRHLSPLHAEGPASYGGERQRVLIFGGRTVSGLTNELWALDFDGDGATPLSPQWRLIEPTGTEPSAREHARAVVEPPGQNDRLLIFGGLNAQGDALGEFWEIELSRLSTDSQQAPRWIQRMISGGAPAKAGHSLVYDTRFQRATLPERFNGSSWEGLHASRRWMELYPFIFLLSSGDAFYAGPGSGNYIFQDMDGSMPQLDETLIESDYPGGTAVLFDTDRIMKCGSQGSTGTVHTETIDFAGNGAWTSDDDMPTARTKHNLTLLPTGDVLMTGGGQLFRLPITDISGAATRAPLVWSPSSGWASDSLRQEGCVRDYHSTALLLPDGRILSAGGEAAIYVSGSSGPLTRETATIFWPPYLFKQNGTLATRPRFGGANINVAWGDTLVICSLDATKITSVVLMRPGSITHQFNMDQRRVELDWSLAACSPQRRINAIVPNQPNLVPPGDYLIFILEGSVPALARWVRIGSAATSADPNCNCTYAGGGSPLVPIKHQLHQNLPNPFSSSTAIQFDLPASAAVKVVVFDVAGRLVRSLLDEERPAGRWSIDWDGTDDSGNRVSSGIYFYCIHAGEYFERRKLVIAR